LIATSRLLLVASALVFGCAPPPRRVATAEVHVLAPPEVPKTDASAEGSGAGDTGMPDAATTADTATPEADALTAEGYELSDGADPRPLGALCRGPWRGVGEPHPYRGVRPEDNGGGECCPLEGRAFLCVITPGHQHEQFIYEHARFFDGESTRPRVSLPAAVFENLGMAHGARSIVHLEAIDTGGAFLLRPDASVCARPTAAVRDVCKAAGRYTWRNGLPVRL
jgi:hypothetical protein